VAYIANAKNTKDRERQLRREQERILRMYRTVIQTPEGRALLYHLAQLAGVGKSCWEQSARIHYNAGRQDFGLELLRDVRLVSEELFELMHREAWAREHSDNNMAQALATPSATEEVKDED
jgi:hypothetical protein